MKDLSLSQPQGDEGGDTSANAANGTNDATEAEASGETKVCTVQVSGSLKTSMHCKMGVIMV